MGKIHKKRIIVWLIAVVLVIIVYGVGKSLATSNSMYKTQKIDGLSFENAVIDYSDNLSTFTVDVYNENKNTYKMKSINIIFKNKNKDKVTLTYEIDKLESDEGRKIIIDKIDYNLSEYENINYSINK